MSRKLSKSDLAIWAKLHPVDEAAANEREDRQRSCSHAAWAHRNDGKISTCYGCGMIRDNEP